jgi:hypothetical protein
VKSKNSSKLFDPQPQTNTNFTHFHVSLLSGFIVLTTPYPPEKSLNHLIIMENNNILDIISLKLRAYLPIKTI